MSTATGAAVTRAIAAVRDDEARAAAADSPAIRAGVPCDWTVCPTTLSALALVRRSALRQMLEMADHWVAESTSFGIDHGQRHPDASPIWRGVGAVTLHARKRGRLVADIHLHRPDGRFLRHAEQLFDGIDELPDTLIAALHGRPVATYVAHPLFAGIAFDDTDGQGRPLTPASTIPVDGDLMDRVDARRLAMLRACRS